MVQKRIFDIASNNYKDFANATSRKVM